MDKHNIRINWQIAPIYNDISEFGEIEDFSLKNKLENILLIKNPKNISYNITTSNVYVAAKCSSTLDLARHLLENDKFPDWSCVIATMQWAGRGQFRRNWVSPKGNLYLALRLPKLSKKCTDFSSLLAGFLVRETLLTLGLESLQLKWPNDLIFENRKIGGILIEERAQVQILGIGLNLIHAPTDDEMREQSLFPAGILPRQIYDKSLATIIEIFIATAYKWIPLFEEMSDKDLIDLFEQQCCFLGQKIKIQDGNEKKDGIFDGITADGALKLLRKDGLCVIHNGSILL